MIITHCPICGQPASSRELFPQNFTPKDINPATFSARRRPDRLHYRLVKCSKCGLVRSNPILSQTTLDQLYNQSQFTYESEIPLLRRTYTRYLQKALKQITRPHPQLLEIGCGNGFMLEVAKKLGCRVTGLELSQHAVSKAIPKIRAHINTNPLKKHTFPPKKFDLICMFQTLDHIAHPNQLLALCHRFLADDGRLLLFHHNVASLSAKILGEKSPIIDIEHTHLYSPSTLNLLLQTQQFTPTKWGSAYNTLSVKHLLHLLTSILNNQSITQFPNHQNRFKALPSSLSRLPLTLPLGNLYVIAKKSSGVTQAFDQDAQKNQGYRYTTNAPLSSRTANQRLSEAIYSLTTFKNKTVVDIGCGDGTYTYELLKKTKPVSVVGLDPATQAITSARQHFIHPKLTFSIGSAYHLPYQTNQFDSAVLRGVLHHLDQPQQAIGEALRVAKEVIILEPNGYSPVLKLIEKISPYHRQHQEKSYPPHQLNQWLTSTGAKITHNQFVNFVPMFFPSPLVPIAKRIEPLIESLPLVKQLFCAVYVVRAEKL